MTASHISSTLGGADYYAADSVIPIYGLGLCAMVYNVILVSLVNLRHDTRYVMFTFVVAALANIGLNLALTPTIGLVGAAVATSASWILVSMLLLLKCLKLFELHFDLSLYARLFTIGLGLFALILAVKTLVPITLLNMVVLGLAVLFIYVSAMLAARVIRWGELARIFRNLLSR